MSAKEKQFTIEELIAQKKAMVDIINADTERLIQLVKHKIVIEAENKKLKEALKPFAALVKHFDGTFGMRPTTGVIQAWDDKYGCDELTVEMLKQAETLLISLEK